jgi:hypothetical protein
MAITDAELSDVRTALWNPDNRAALLDYNSRRLALLSAVICIAAGTAYFPARQYGEVLEQLVYDAASRNTAKATHDQVIASSRDLGLHTSTTRSGYDITLHTPPELEALLQESGLRDQAVAWYRDILESNSVTPTNSIAARLRLQAAVRSDMLLAPILTGCDEITLRQIAGRLNILLTQYFPENC